MSVIDDRMGLPYPPVTQRSGWRRRGTELKNRVAALVGEARAIFGDSLAVSQIDATEPGRTAEVVSALTWLCIEHIRASPADEKSADACRLVCDLQRLAIELFDHEMASRTRRVAACEAGLARLRALATSASLIDGACDELCASGGFGRALLSRVDAGTWTPWVLTELERPNPNNWFDRWGDTGVPLDTMTLETRLVAERRPELVHDVTAPGVHPMVQTGKSNSYVVAPIMPAGKVVGFFHADHYPSDQHCDESDRDVLWAFAEGFGHIYERTVLLERLRSQRDEIRDTFGLVESAMNELTDSEIELAVQPEARSPVTRTAVSVLNTMGRALDDLTKRELEVLELMVAGAPNQAIAEQLVITEGTVKSHVKHILRKLGAVNRSQAIAYYLGVSREMLDGGLDPSSR